MHLCLKISFIPVTFVLDLLKAMDFRSQTIVKR